MLKIFFCFIVVIKFITTSEASSSLAFSYSLNNVSNYSKSQEENLKHFIQDAYSRLPKSLVESLPTQINLSFRVFNDIQNISQLCENDPSRVILGTISTFNISKSRRGVYLSSIFASYILNRDTTSIPPECSKPYLFSHDTIYEIALGTFIHEIIHTYDYWVEEDRYQKHCIRQENKSSQCELKSNFAPSKDNSFLLLANFNSSARNKNVNSPSIINPHEFSNFREAFAINLELYLMRDDYHCKRPHLSRYFSNLFNISPNISCEKDFFAMVAETHQLFELNLNRIVGADYILAGPGRESGSQFGHSMLRLIVCDEDHTSISECRNDESNDIIISYRGDVGLEVSPWQGIVGGYELKLYFYRMSQIKDSYVSKELRSLHSYPLNLDRSQLETLVKKVFSDFWEYSSNYYFITRNCASELNDLIRSVTTHSDVVDFNRGAGIVTPQSLLGRLIRTGLTSSENFQDLSTDLSEVIGATVDKIALAEGVSNNINSLLSSPRSTMAFVDAIHSFVETEDLSSQERVNIIRLIVWLRGQVRSQHSNEVITQSLEKQGSNISINFESIGHLERKLRPRELMVGKYGITDESFDSFSSRVNLLVDEHKKEMEFISNHVDGLTTEYSILLSELNMLLRKVIEL
jgi:hypothetical protein